MKMDSRRSGFIDAAFVLFGQKGIANTSITDITNYMGVAHSLFYHYFANKDELVEAVADDRVDRFVAYMVEYEQQIDHSDNHTLMVSLVAAIRAYVLGSESMYSFMTHESNGVIRSQFSVRSSTRLAERFSSRILKRQGKLESRVKAQHPFEAIYVLVGGVVSLFSNHPDVDDEAIVEVVANTLKIDDGEVAADVAADAGEAEAGETS